MSESSTSAASTASSAEELLSAIDSIGEKLAAKFTKQYSTGRLEQIMSHLATISMLVSHIHDEAVREEHEDRKGMVLERMIRDERLPVAEAQQRVEAGVR